jgi:hypothetical protein
MRTTISSEARRAIATTARVSAASGRSAHAPAREQVAVALGDGHELELGGVDELATGHDRQRGGPSGDLWVEGEEELVHEAGGEQVRVERRPSLAEHGADAVRLLEVRHQPR